MYGAVCSVVHPSLESLFSPEEARTRGLLSAVVVLLGSLLHTPGTLVDRHLLRIQAGQPRGLGVLEEQNMKEIPKRCCFTRRKFQSNVVLAR